MRCVFLVCFSCVSVCVCVCLCVCVDSSSIMEELDVPQMRREVESLQYQLAINREKSSITVTELVKWIEGCVCDDPFLNPELMRANPWVEKGKCVIL
ncbi:guanine nucleotide-binding protein G(I)/G(S)/G(O) subunit gamma-13-like isoform X1 [Cyclopterus lumpus]|nr:guanine nucleotide-binding protein G(I)/G(S)/G(O) subunit gamma-13-like isoform X1 [Cyclopterus lumpus]